MCDVCVAEQAILAARMKPDEGYRVQWTDDNPPDVPVFVRAHGEPEGPGEYQLRRDGEPWPELWRQMLDVAGSMALHGLDKRWRLVAEPMRQYVMGERAAAPEDAELLALLDAEQKRRYPNGFHWIEVTDKSSGLRSWAKKAGPPPEPATEG